MHPRHKQDAAPKPASGYTVIRQVRRVHLRAGRDSMVKAEQLRRAVDGLHQRFFFHAHEALLPRRKYPMSNAHFHRFITSLALPEAPLLRASLLAKLCLLYVSGFCKAELTAYLPERTTLLTRASLLWVIGGVFHQAPLTATAGGPLCRRQMRSLPAPEQMRCDGRGLGRE
eukprot:6211822-Pleurochrysis_carterae.AAC.7